MFDHLGDLTEPVCQKLNPALADSKVLLPALIDFFKKHPLIEPKTFLGDAAFDTIEIYKSLFRDVGFRKAFIPLRIKLAMEEITQLVTVLVANKIHQPQYIRGLKPLIV